MLGLGECSLLVLFIFWAVRSMTQFETDTVYLHEEVNNISKSSVCFLNRCLFHSYMLPWRKGVVSSTAPISDTQCLQRGRFSEVAVVQRPPRRGLHPAPPASPAARLDEGVGSFRLCTQWGPSLINSFITWHSLV